MTNLLQTHFIYFWIILLSVSCQSDYNENNLARFKDIYLNKSDIINEIPITLNQTDSTIFANNYIHKWLVNQMIMDKSEEMIPMEVQKVEKKIFELPKRQMDVFLFLPNSASISNLKFI